MDKSPRNPTSMQAMCHLANPHTRSTFSRFIPNAHLDQNKPLRLFEKRKKSNHFTQSSSILLTFTSSSGGNESIMFTSIHIKQSGQRQIPQSGSKEARAQQQQFITIHSINSSFHKPKSIIELFIFAHRQSPRSHSRPHQHRHAHQHYRLIDHPNMKSLPTTPTHRHDDAFPSLPLPNLISSSLIFSSLLRPSDPIRSDHNGLNERNGHDTTLRNQDIQHTNTPIQTSKTKPNKKTDL